MTDTTNTLSSELSTFSRTPSPVSGSERNRRHQSSPPPSQPRIKRQRRRTVVEKTANILDIFRSQDLSLYDFLWQCRNTADGAVGPTFWAELLRKLHRPDDRLMLSIYNDLGRSEVDPDARKRDLVAAMDRCDWGADILRKEVKDLPVRVGFYSRHAADEDYDFEAKDLDTMRTKVEEVAPHLCSLLRRIMQPLASRTEESRDRMTGSIVAILGILCFNQQKKLGSGMQSRFATYLHCNATRTAVIEVFHTLGLCINRTSLQAQLQERSNRGEAEIQNIGKKPSAVLQYDNLEQLQRVKEQRLDSNDKHMSVTTGYLIDGARIPPDGLKSSMINYNVPLEVSDVLEAPGVKKGSPEMKQVKSFLSRVVDIRLICLSGDVVANSRVPSTITSFNRVSTMGEALQ